MNTDAPEERLRNELIAIAKSPEPRIAYSEVDHIMGLDVNLPDDRKQFSRVLAKMGAIEVRARRPFLPAVVVRKDTCRPGRGFPKQVRALLPKYRHIEDDVKLYYAVLSDVTRYWSRR